ncbi:MAG: dTDP-glucose 4,6-dehydratase [candidate division Zixibacteria bacterium]|nr:dTDP-glucose 4,6-dehydratase [candidate division Zixibacteria bacterium]
MRVLITGGAGFIGSNFIRYLINNRPDWQITNFDNLTYAGNLANLDDLRDNDNYRFIKGDISNIDDVRAVLESGFDNVVNFAAESHVDRSLYDPGIFIKTNVLGTQLLLDLAQKTGISKFLQVSTDEVYGSQNVREYADEKSPLLPNSPYAASKASADLVCRSYFKSFDMPVIITRSCNNYGPFQFPEKVIPFFMTRALKDEILPLYGDGLNSRDWIYVEDNCEALLRVLESGDPGQIYNIGSNNELTNLDLTQIILKLLGKPSSLIKFVEDRPAHDRRYGLNFDKIENKLGWLPKIRFIDGIQKTIDWYLANKQWWENIISGEYRKFYEQHYRNLR